MTKVELDRLGTLALAWVATRKRAGRPAELRRALRDWTPIALDTAAGAASFDELLAHLSAQQWVDATAGLSLAPQGKQQLLAALSRSKLPVGATWARLRAELAARAAGAEGASAPHLRAAVIAHGLGLRLSGAPTLPAVRNALAWKALGHDDDGPFRRAEVVRRSVCAQLASARADTEGQALALLAAKLAGARQVSTDELRRAALRRWLEPAPAQSGGKAPSRASPDLGAFADNILKLARATPTGRYGDKLVFISHVFRRAREEGQGGSVDQFKSRLALAHQAGLLRLSRADLVEAMDPADVAASELALQGATFHFVRI